jgi:paraquat-inducible protein B
MSRRADPFTIGAFALGAVAVAVGAVLLFGSGTLFQKKSPHVSYFHGSLSGLSVGSPVTFRGVKVGEVTSIRLKLDVNDFKATIPVYYYIDRSKIEYSKGDSSWITPREVVRRGLRAQLVTLSFVTGQQAVDLDFRPDIAGVFLGNLKDVPEVPVMTSEFESVKERLTSLPVEELSQSALQLMRDIDAVVAAPETRALLVSLANLSDNLDKTDREALRPGLDSVKQMFDAATVVIEKLKTSLDRFDTAANAVKGTSDAATNVLLTEGPDLRTLLETTDKTLREGQTALAAVSSLVASGRPAREDLDQMLRDLAITARSLRDLSESLERNPNILITGKK